MQADGKGWIYAPTGLQDGPLPTHYEPQESVIKNPLYGQQCNPARMEWRRGDNPYHRPYDDPRFPLRDHHLPLTEHHTAGGMSPLAVVAVGTAARDVLRSLAGTGCRRAALNNGGWATIRTARAEIEARVLVTERMRPLRIKGRTIHQIGLAVSLGEQGPGARRLRQRTDRVRGRPERFHPGIEGASPRISKPAVESQKAGMLPAARWLPRRRRMRRSRSAASSQQAGSRSTASRRTRAKRGTLMPCRQGILHRHHPLHRLQGLRSGVQAVEPVARRWLHLHRHVVRQHGATGRVHVAARGLHRAARAVANAGCRQPFPGCSSPMSASTARAPAAWRVAPPGAIIRTEFDSRLRAAGHLQRLRLLRGELPVRRHRPARGRWPRVEVHALLRPAEGRHEARLRQGVSHRIHPIRRRG